MTCAWIGTIYDLKKIVGDGTYIQDITNGFESNYHKAAQNEINSWKESIPEFLLAVADNKFNQLQVLIEFQMPIGAERADLILLGGSKEHVASVIIELKQWTSFTVSNKFHDVAVPGLGLHPHPSIQVLNYKGKLHFFNARAHNYEMYSAVFAHNTTNNEKHLLIDEPVPREWIVDAPVFNSNDIISLTTYLEEHLLPCDLDPTEGTVFDNAPYEQSRHLFKFLSDYAREIGQEAAIALANSGMGLTTEQELIKNEIIQAVLEKKQIDFLINGGPGSGKTLLAVSLLLKAAENNISCLFAIRNNRLMKILRTVLDKTYPGLSGMMLFFKPMMGGGLNRFNGKVDLLICDEAQRIDSDTLFKAPLKANVTAIFVDETQRLNPPEQGTYNNFLKASDLVGKIHIQKQLKSSVRCMGGEQYHQWVEQLLVNPSNNQLLNIRKQSWQKRYIFEVVETIDDLITGLKKYKQPYIRVGLVASFTESPGVQGKPNDPNNLRVGYPLTSGFDIYNNSNISIPWLMSPEEYSKFWLGGLSNNLNMVASIYGVQGFESDYVGIIWGRDLLYRSGKWILGNPKHCYDNIDGLVSKGGNRNWCTEAFELMINRYRIFLTRGIKGTLVFCEDDETSRYFMRLLNNY